MNQSKLIITLLIIVLVLLILQICLSSKKKENFETNKNKDVKENIDILNSNNKEKVLDMFKSLEDAEQKCAALEDAQYQKEERDNVRDNDRTWKELKEQDKKITELKEIVKYLTIEHKRRSKINSKCRNNSQRKLNKQYDIVRKLNKEGLIKDNSINLDLNLSDNVLKNLVNQNNGTNSTNSTNSTKKCRTKGQDYVNVDSGKIARCSGCDVEKLKSQEPYILKDFS